MNQAKHKPEINTKKDAQRNSSFEKQLEEIYRDQYVELFRFAHARMDTKENALDIVSNSFLKALQHQNQFKNLHPNALKSWIYKIITNEILLFYRRKNVERKYYIAEKHLKSASDEIYEEPVAIELLITSLEELPIKEYNLVQMKYFDRLSFKHIAEITGSSEESLRTGMHRIRKKLAGMLVNMANNKGVELLITISILLILA
jgi:RNA polymerase sigma-70 factor (ECF subfamily)